MNESYIKEILATHRANKTLLWQTLVVVIGGTIGIFFRTLDLKDHTFDVIFILIGCLLAITLAFYISDINSRMLKLTLQLKEKEE